MPRRVLGARRLQDHLLLRAVGAVLGPGVQVHGGQLPALPGARQPPAEPLLLLLVAHVQPVLEQEDAAAHQHLLKDRHRAQELFILRIRAELHDALHASAVVPGAVEEHHLSRRGQVLHVALEVPLRLLALGGLGQGHHAADPGRHGAGDAADDAALASGVAALEQHHHLEPRVLDVLLQPHQLGLQLRQRGLVDEPPHRPVSGLPQLLLAVGHPDPGLRVET
mmetsp:Transcript_17845/g.50253  ORF Transcript_17845/g.50253 Transcript_17845/m.50253 type:complete len:223 (-) Transcript_17845:423-1091(-)